MIKTINDYNQHPKIAVVPNLERPKYLALMKTAAVMVGNSSSGLLEAPTYKLGAVNIGDRQRDRMQTTNVVNVPHEKQAIIKGIRKVLYDETYQEQLRSVVNPYGDGYSSERIVDVLSNIDLGPSILEKRMTY